jgi:hypothetical protein
MENDGQKIKTFEYSGNVIDWVQDMPEWKRFEEHCAKLRIRINFAPKFTFHQDTPPDKAMWAARELVKRLVLAAEKTLAKGVVLLEQEIKKAKAQGRNPVYPVFKSNQSLSIKMPPAVGPQEAAPDKTPEQKITTSEADEIIKDFYIDTRERTDKRIADLHACGFDTRNLVARIEVLRKNLKGISGSESENRKGATENTSSLKPISERDIAQESWDYSLKYNSGKLAMAKERTKSRLAETATREDVYEGLPEWVQTENQRMLFLHEIEKKNYALLDQIGDAYIKSMYGLYPDGKIDVSPDGRIYQLPRGVKPIKDAQIWTKTDNDYILNNGVEGFDKGINIDNIHFFDNGEIHYDPNNPLSNKPQHIWHDKLRRHTDEPKTPGNELYEMGRKKIKKKLGIK